MNWSATPAKVSISLPGDEPERAPNAYFTRAITIDAPLSVVWPRLVHMDQDRAGFHAYNYNWLKILFGGNIHNAAKMPVTRWSPWRPSVTSAT